MANRRFLRLFLLAGTMVAWAAAPGAQAPAGPSIDDLLNLRRVGTPAIAPDGRSVAYTLRETNWDENAYETEIWLADANGTHQLTNAKKSSQQPAWSRDGRWLAFLSDREGKRQIYRIAIQGGEAERLTSGDEDVNAFAWAPDGTRIAFTMTDPISESIKERERRFGEMRIEDQDRRMAHLYLLDVPDRAAPGVKSTAPSPRQLTKGDFVVGSFDWAPDGRQIAFDHRVSSDPADGGTADISIVDVSSGTRSVVVGQNGPDSNPRWSPDGTRIAFVSAMGKSDFYYTNSVIAVVQSGAIQITSLTDKFDENPALVAWNNAGIFFSAAQRAWAYLFRLDPNTRDIVRHAVRDHWIGTGCSLTPDASRVAFIASDPTEFADVYLASLAPGLDGARRATNTAEQIASWPKQLSPARRDDFRYRSPGQCRSGRSPSRGRDGMESGWLHFGVFDHQAFRPLQGGVGRRRHLQLDDVLRQHRHPPVHAAISRSDAEGRSEDLC